MFSSKKKHYTTEKANFLAGIFVELFALYPLQLQKNQKNLSIDFKTNYNYLNFNFL